MMIKAERPAPVISGTFDAQRFFDTLALIISRRENVKVTVTVSEEGRAVAGSSMNGIATPETAAI